jgi:hypothetical protein
MRKAPYIDSEVCIAILIHAFHPLEAIDCYAISIMAEPHENPLRVAEDKIHSLDLVALLFIILLINAKRIRP